MLFDFSRKSGFKFGVWMWGTPKGKRSGGGENFREFPRYLSGNFREFPWKSRQGWGGSLDTKNDIVTRQLKIVGHGLHEMNSMIILDSPVEYLRNDKYHQRYHLFPHPFICLTYHYGNLLILQNQTQWSLLSTSGGVEDTVCKCTLRHHVTCTVKFVNMTGHCKDYNWFGHLWGEIFESLEPVVRVQCWIFRHETFTGFLFHQYAYNCTNDLTRAEFWVRTSFFRNLDNYVKSFWLDCELNKFTDVICRVWHRNCHFQMKTELIWNFQYRISFATYVFCTLNMSHIDEKTQTAQYLHVKHQNTRKNTIKMD